MQPRPQLTPTRKQLIRLQRRIYESLKRDVSRLLGPAPEAIQAYERAFRGEFRSALRGQKPRAIPKTQFLNELDESPIVFVGDYHTDPQAQKTALRLLRELRERHPSDEWILAIEMIPSQHQKALDAYLAGRTSVEKFHRAIRYREEWGFPWEHYAPLFAYARENGIPVVGLNRPRALNSPHSSRKKPSDDLRSRDQWAAGILTDRFVEIYARKKKPRALVLYGEMHLASKHLPHSLRSVSRAFFGKRGDAMRSATVFLNHDELYFKFSHSNDDPQREIVKLSESRYCLLNGTPWGKLQSVINWVEGSTESLADDENAETEDLWEVSSTPDELMRIAAQVKWLAEFFKVPAPSVDRLQVIAIRDADRMLDLLREYSTQSKLDFRERKALRYHWTHNQRVYVPSLQTAYIGSPSFNASTEMAALFLLTRMTGRSRLVPSTEDGWFELALESAFGFLGSLLANPKRKCDFVRDHRRRLAALRHSENPAFPDEIAARKLAIAALSRGGEAKVLRAYASSSVSEFMAAVLAARWVGKVLAKLLYPQMMSGQITLDQLREWFLVRPRDGYQARYAEIASLTLKLKSSRAHVRSKADHF